MASRIQPWDATGDGQQRIGLGVEAFCRGDVARCSAISGAGMRRKSKRWQRLSTVAGILWGSVVASMKRAWGGGSSSVFSSALNALLLSMWTSSMM